MKVLPESFGAALGIFRPLLQDDGVMAISIHGHESAWVERVGTPPRGMEPLKEDAFARLLDALGGLPQKATYVRMAQGGHVRVLPAPVRGGALVILSPGHLTPLALDALCPLDVVDTLRRCVAGGLGVLVTGSSADVRLGVVGALWESTPMDRRRGLLEIAPSGVLPLGAMHWCTAGEGASLPGLASARLAAICVPELHLGGPDLMRTAALVGSVLGSVSGVDAGGARAALGALGPETLALAAGVFHVLVEVGPDPQHGGVRVLSLWDGRAVLGGGLPAPWWRCSAGLPAGTWTGSPAFAWRLPQRLPTAVPEAQSGDVPLQAPPPGTLAALHAEASMSGRATIPTSMPGGPLSGTSPTALFTDPQGPRPTLGTDEIPAFQSASRPPVDSPTADLDELGAVMEPPTSPLRPAVSGPTPPADDEWIHQAPTSPLPRGPLKHPDVTGSRRAALPAVPVAEARKPTPQHGARPPTQARVVTRAGALPAAPPSAEDFEDGDGTLMDSRPAERFSDVFSTMQPGTKK
jgi:hypothetical protein